MFGVQPYYNSMGVYTFSKVGLSISKAVACSTASPHIDEDKLACRNRGRVTSWIFLINPYPNPLWECSYDIEYVNVIPVETQ